MMEKLRSLELHFADLEARLPNRVKRLLAERRA